MANEVLDPSKFGKDANFWPSTLDYLTTIYFHFSDNAAWDGVNAGWDDYPISNGAGTGWSNAGGINKFSADRKTMTTSFEFISPAPDALANTKLNYIVKGSPKTFAITTTKFAGADISSDVTEVFATVSDWEPCKTTRIIPQTIELTPFIYGVSSE